MPGLGLTLTQRASLYELHILLCICIIMNDYERINWWKGDVHFLSRGRSERRPEFTKSAASGTALKLFSDSCST